MITISPNILAKTSSKKEKKERKERKSLLKRYIDYTASKEKEGLFWYLKVIIAIPCVFMVFSIFAMSMLTTNFIWFVGLSMLLFFANVLVHISGSSSRIFIPLYHATIAIFFLVPLITYLIKML